MAAELAVGYVSLVPSAKGFGSAIEKEIGHDLTKAGTKAGDDTSKQFGSAFSKGLKTVGKVLAAAAIVDFAVQAGGAVIEAASNQAESLSKVNVVFGESADEIKKWAEGAAKAFGQSETQALDAVGTYGNLLQAFGLTGDAAKTMSIDMVELASDLASFNNTSVEDALAALQSGLSGESEPLKRYGVALSDVRLRQEALAQGLIKTTKDAMTPAIKAQATYGLVMKDTALAQGDFERTSDGLANKQRIAKAQFDNLTATIGEKLIPIMAKLTEAFIVAVEWVQENWPAIEKTIGDTINKIVTVWNAVGKPVFDAIVEATTALTIWTQEHWAQISGYVEGAIGTITTVIETFVGWATQFWRTFGDEVGKIFVAAFGFIKGQVEAALKIIRGIIDVVMGLIRLDFSQVWDGIKQIFSGVLDGIKNIVKLSFDLIKAAIQAAMTVIAGILDGAWSAIKSGVSAAIGEMVDLVQSLPGRAAAALGGLLTALGSVISGAFDWAKRLARDAIDDIVDFVKGLPGRMLALVGNIANAAEAIGRGIVNGIVSGAKSIAGIGADIANAITGAFKSAWNAVAGYINDRLPNDIGVDTPFGRFGIDLPDNPIPTLHEGGVVPGSAGQDVAAILQGGEVVLNQRQQTALLSALTGRTEVVGSGVQVGTIVAADPRAAFAELDRLEWRRRVAASAA